MIDLNSKKEGFLIDEETCSTPKALFFNTGRMKANPEVKEMEKADIIEAVTLESELNDFVVTEPAQVKLRYVVLCEFYKKVSF